MITLSSTIGIRVAEQNNSFVLYNTLNDRCVKIDRKSYEIYKKIIESKDTTISDLKKCEVCDGINEQEIESLISFLLEKGFVYGD